jgi:uncharacterized membrane protein
MSEVFDRFHRRLGRATIGVLCVALALLALALASALVGLVDAVPGFRQAALAVGYVFAGLFVLFLTTSVAGAAVRYLARPAGPNV